MYMSSIDDVEMDSDIDGNGNVVTWLILHGDFVDACDDYLDNERSGKLRLRISHNIAENLVKEVSKYL